jgi:hypothetical protein
LTHLTTQHRDLRAAREARRDEPGAADFYYGEMEMRRYTAQAWSMERMVLTGYWLLSGYGLRAGRALLTLVVALLAGAVLFQRFGLTAPDPSFSDALLVSGESATSLFREEPSGLTARGEAIQVVLRLLGPGLLALAAVAIRGREKR